MKLSLSKPAITTKSLIGVIIYHFITWLKTAIEGNNFDVSCLLIQYSSKVEKLKDGTS
jgi:hypothetical protein